jgi:hypothetical protein
MGLFEESSSAVLNLTATFDVESQLCSGSAGLSSAVVLKRRAAVPISRETHSEGLSRRWCGDFFRSLCSSGSCPIQGRCRIVSVTGPSTNWPSRTQHTCLFPGTLDTAAFSIDPRQWPARRSHATLKGRGDWKQTGRFPQHNRGPRQIAQRRGQCATTRKRVMGPHFRSGDVSLTTATPRQCH